MFDSQQFREKLEDLMNYHNFILQQYYQVAPISVTKTYESMMQVQPLMQALATDVVNHIHTMKDSSDVVLFEGAQGTLLDIDHGTYPFVTSSNTLSGAACIGSGVGPSFINRVIGVAKAYCTRVGSGPFPSEMEGEIGQRIGDRGHEFGSTTGRMRRCGWLDLVALKRAIQLNGITDLCITKLDVLDGLASIQMCMAYEYKGKRLKAYPASLEQMTHCKPIYENVPGWQEETAGIQQFVDLPEQAKHYIGFIERECGVPAKLISTGPQRDSVIMRDSLGAEERT
jgi:adenylosuccinate synthase